MSPTSMVVADVTGEVGSASRNAALGPTYILKLRLTADEKEADSWKVCGL